MSEPRSWRTGSSMLETLSTKMNILLLIEFCLCFCCKLCCVYFCQLGCILHLSVVLGEVHVALPIITPLSLLFALLLNQWLVAFGIGHTAWHPFHRGFVDCWLNPKQRVMMSCLSEANNSRHIHYRSRVTLSGTPALGLNSGVLWSSVSTPSGES